ncbi:MAG: prephenate dehydratase [Bacteroidales bacterium]|nr:prephenate dehydratase [Bacteroidales bacterium]
MTATTQNTLFKIAIQGGKGAFHELAARTYFPNLEFGLHTCETFQDVFTSLAENHSQVGVMAIENSVSGSILPNYALLRKHGMIIRGEVYLRIVQNLMALPGETLSSIKEIHSHPVAIQQCELFLEPLRKKGVKIIETSDTALSARRIRKEQLSGVAALASSLAAELYDLEILARGVESDSINFTRFLILSGKNTPIHHLAPQSGTIDKASLCFALPHETGSLSTVLSILASHGMNLTKIQSMPIVGKAWQYFFHIDLVFGKLENYRNALLAIQSHVDQLMVLGEYHQGIMPVEEESETMWNSQSSSPNN